MTYMTKAVALAVIASAPLSVAAQEFRGMATLGYGHSSVSNGGGDVSSYTLEGTSTISFNSGIHLGFDASLVSTDSDQPGGDADANFFGFQLNYQFASGWVIGGYVENLDLESDIDITSYGASGGYVTDTYGVELSIGESETSPSLPNGVDLMDYGLNVRYMVSDNFRLGGHYILSELSGPGGSADLTSFGVGGTYRFVNGLSAFAGINRTEVDDANAKSTNYGLGVAYDLSRITQLPGSVSLELARNDISQSGASADVDTIRLGFSIPLGGAKGEPPLNSAARAAMSPRHNALSNQINAAF